MSATLVSPHARKHTPTAPPKAPKGPAAGLPEWSATSHPENSPSPGRRPHPGPPSRAVTSSEAIDTLERPSDFRVSFARPGANGEDGRADRRSRIRVSVETGTRVPGRGPARPTARGTDGEPCFLAVPCTRGTQAAVRPLKNTEKSGGSGVRNPGSGIFRLGHGAHDSPGRAVRVGRARSGLSAPRPGVTFRQAGERGPIRLLARGEVPARQMARDRVRLAAQRGHAAPSARPGVLCGFSAGCSSPATPRRPAVSGLLRSPLSRSRVAVESTSFDRGRSHGGAVERHSPAHDARGRVFGGSTMSRHLDAFERLVHATTTPSVAQLDEFIRDAQADDPPPRDVLRAARELRASLAEAAALREHAALGLRGRWQKGAN